MVTKPDKAVLRVDGGMTINNWAMQFLCNSLQVPVDRPKVLETTALGAAWLAGMKAGLYPGQAQFAKSWSLQRRFSPNMDASRVMIFTRAGNMPSRPPWLSKLSMPQSIIALARIGMVLAFSPAILCG